MTTGSLGIIKIQRQLQKTNKVEAEDKNVDEIFQKGRRPEHSSKQW
jgi:hypothetical protein